MVEGNDVKVAEVKVADDNVVTSGVSNKKMEYEFNQKSYVLLT